MAKKKRMAIPDPTLGEIWFVLTAAPRWEVEDRKGVSDAYVDFHLKRHAFMRRATAATWADTVAAARRLHREIKAAEATSRRRIVKEPNVVLAATTALHREHIGALPEGLFRVVAEDSLRAPHEHGDDCDDDGSRPGRVLGAGAARLHGDQ